MWSRVVLCERMCHRKEPPTTICSDSQRNSIYRLYYTRTLRQCLVHIFISTSDIEDADDSDKFRRTPRKKSPKAKEIQTYRDYRTWENNAYLRCNYGCHSTLRGFYGPLLGGCLRLFLERLFTSLLMGFIMSWTLPSDLTLYFHVFPDGFLSCLDLTTWPLNQLDRSPSGPVARRGNSNLEESYRKFGLSTLACQTQSVSQPRRTPTLWKRTMRMARWPLLRVQEFCFVLGSLRCARRCEMVRRSLLVVASRRSGPSTTKG